MMCLLLRLRSLRGQRGRQALLSVSQESTRYRRVGASESFSPSPLYTPRCFLRVAESLIAGFVGASATACLKAAVASSCFPILSKLRPKLYWASADFGSDFIAF